MSEPTNFEKMRGLKWQLLGNAFTSIFATTNFFGGSMFILFLNELHLDTARIGFLLSLLQLFGIVALFSAPYSARFGVKKTWLTYCAVRVVFVSMLLFIPFITNHYGPGASFAILAFSMSGFALAKTIGETANTSWQQEIIPDIIRGKFSAYNAIITQLLGAGTVLIGGYLIGKMAGLKPYMILISSGLISGILCVWAYGNMPGGKPAAAANSNSSHFNEMYESLAKDRNFLKYIIGLILVSIGFAVALTFIALFMKNAIGLPPRVVVWLDIATFIGTVGSSYFWGWAADRYGSKPIMLVGPILLCLFPVICFLMPRHSVISVFPAILVMLLIGISNMAWNIGFQRYLFVTAIAPGKRTSYIAVWYALYSLAGTVGVFASGLLLKIISGFHLSLLSFSIDQYIVIFLIGIFLTIIGITVLSTLRAGTNDISILQFFKMFLKGNPIIAFRALLMHKWAQSEHARIRIIHHFGRSKSPLSKFELISSLHDPSFNIRLEAVIAIANHSPDKEFVKALGDVIVNDNLQIAGAAIWALGRMNAFDAIPVLRTILESKSTGLSAPAARGLAMLGDSESVESIAAGLLNEKRIEDKIDFAYALGRLKAQKYSPEILAIMKGADGKSVKQQASLAAAMLMGDEGQYVRFLNLVHSDHGTGIAQTLWSYKKIVPLRFSSLCKNMELTAAAFAKNDLNDAKRYLSGLITEMISTYPDNIQSKILGECLKKIDSADSMNDEYILLAIYAIKTAFSGNISNV